jgi:hypothetical protein
MSSFIEVVGQNGLAAWLSLFAAPAGISSCHQVMSFSSCNCASVNAQCSCLASLSFSPLLVVLFLTVDRG